MRLARAARRHVGSALAAVPSFLRDVRDIHRLVTDPELSLPYYPGEPRKTRARMLADLLLWRVGRGEVNRYYYCWGMDRVNGPRARDLLSYRQFMRLRDRRNGPRAPGWLDYLALMRDKYLFALLVERLGYPTPPLVALAGPEGVEWLHPRRAPVPLASLLHVPGGVDVFCKPRFGIQGKSVFRLKLCDGRAWADGRPATIDELAARMEHVVWQQPIAQHPALAAFHPSSVNTVRIIRRARAHELLANPGDDEHALGMNRDGGERPREGACVAEVDGRVATVEQPGFRQQEDARTRGAQHRTAAADATPEDTWATG